MTCLNFSQTQRVKEMISATLDNKSVGISIKFFEDPRVTALLNELEINFDVESVAIKSIDINDLECQTRLNVAVINNDTVTKYSEEMRRGDQFPMIVLARRKDGKFRVVCGNHRCKAATLSAKGSHLEAIVIDCNTGIDAMRVLATRDNASHGDKTTSKECLEIAVSTLMRMPLHDNQQQHSIEIISNIASKMRIKTDCLRDNYVAALMRAVMKSHDINLLNGTHVNLLAKLWGNWLRTGSTSVLSAVAQAITRDATDNEIMKEIAKRGALPGSLSQRIGALSPAAQASLLRTPPDLVSKILAAAMVIKNSLLLLDHPGNVSKEKVSEIVSICNENAHLSNAWSKK